jgi:hypothetical protein
MAFEQFPLDAEFDNEFHFHLVINEAEDNWGLAYDLATRPITDRLPNGWFAWACESSSAWSNVARFFTFPVHNSTELAKRWLGADASRLSSKPLPSHKAPPSRGRL